MKTVKQLAPRTDAGQGKKQRRGVQTFARAALLMTQIAYARHRKCSRQFISKLVRTQRIPVNRRGLINSKKADAVLEATRCPGRVIASKRKLPFQLKFAEPQGSR